jgi:hypothetical protein
MDLSFSLRDCLKGASHPKIEYINGSVHVSVEDQTTMNTGMSSYTEVFMRSFQSAPAASLAGFVAIHFGHANEPTSMFGFVGTKGDKATPTSVHD